MPRPSPDSAPSRLVILASVCVVVAALYFARELLVPLALAVLLSFVLAPLVKMIERRGLPCVPSVMLVVVLAFALLGAVGWLVTNQLLELANGLPNYRQNLITKIHSMRGVGPNVLTQITETAADLNRELTAPTTAPVTSLSTSGPTTSATQDAVVDLLAPDESQGAATTRPAVVPVEVVGTEVNPIWVWIKESPPKPLDLLTNALGPILGPLGTAGIVIVFVIFILLGREDLRDRVLRLMGESQLHTTTQALDDAASRISRYLLAQSIVNGTYGLAIALGLQLIGMTFGGDIGFPSIALWGLLCAVLRFIPYLGPWLAAAFPLLLSLAVFPDMQVFVATLILFVFIELLSNNFMEPWLYGSSTGLSTIAVIASAVFWTWLWGPIGLVLATPLTSCVVVLGKHVHSLQFLDVLLGDSEILSMPQKVYQRLLAADEEGATDVVDDALAENTLEQVYEDVLLPALALAELNQHRGNIDEGRRDFIRRVMREIVDDIAERPESPKSAATAQKNADAAEKAASSTGQVEAPSTSDKSVKTTDAKGDPVEPPKIVARPRLPDGCEVRVVCLPARDVADEIVGVMLMHLLRRNGYYAKTLSVMSLANEMAIIVKDERADLVVVSALPPAAVAHARYLCKRLRSKFDTLPLVVGLWTVRSDPTKVRARLDDVSKFTLASTLGSALEHIHGMTSLLHNKASDTPKNSA